MGLLDRLRGRSQSSDGVSLETTFMTAVQMIRQGPGYYYGAEDLLVRVVRAAPNFVQAYDQLAELYCQMGRRDDAIGIYLSLLGVNERNARRGVLDVWSREPDSNRRIVSFAGTSCTQVVPKAAISPDCRPFQIIAKSLIFDVSGLFR